MQAKAKRIAVLKKQGIAREVIATAFVSEGI